MTFKEWMNNTQLSKNQVVGFITPEGGLKLTYLNGTGHNGPIDFIDCNLNPIAEYNGEYDNYIICGEQKIESWGVSLGIAKPHYQKGIENE